MQLMVQNFDSETVHRHPQTACVDWGKRYSTRTKNVHSQFIEIYTQFYLDVNYRAIIQ